MADLTDSQQQQLNDRRRTNTLRPVYYDAATQREVVISEDFEGFLILLEDEVRASIQDRLSEDAVTQVDRDELYREALLLESEDALLMLTDSNIELDGFADFRKQLSQTSFFNSSETAAMLSDMQTSKREMVEGYEEHLHRYNIIVLLSALHQNAGSNEHRDLQRSSWPLLIDEYAP